MTTRRNQLLKLLANIDQNIAEAESLTVDVDLDATEKFLADRLLIELRESLERIKRLLQNERKKP